MNKKGTRIISIALSLLMIFTLFTGCSNNNNENENDNNVNNSQDNDTSNNTNNNASDENENTSENNSKDTKIANGDVTLTYWIENIAFETDTTMAETPFYKELEEITGVKIEFIHPPQGQTEEQFNLMIASNELADLIEYNWLGFPGGPEKALQEEIIINLNEQIDNNAPNLKQYLNDNPDIDKIIKTDESNYYVFPFVRGDDMLMISYGPQVRKDLLEDLSLEMPETISEWENMLIKFKDELSLEAPLTIYPWQLRINRLGSFILGAYGVAGDFYVENNKMEFGPINQGFKDGLELLNDWYDKGLLDPDFASQDSQAFNAKVTGGKTGAFVATPGGGMGSYLTTMKNEGADFDLTGVKWPVLEKGETPKFGMKDFAYIGHSSVAISTECENKDVAAKWLDYGYSEDGHMTYNFGIEGESYEMIDGYPTYTDYITDNEDGLSMAVTTRRYMRSSTGGPFVQDPRYMVQYLQYPQQVEALDIWAEHDDSRRIPPMTPTPEESERLSSIMSEVNTYVDEEMLKFIMGQKEIDQFDEYVDQIKDMGIDEAIEIQQSALDRFLNR